MNKNKYKYLLGNTGLLTLSNFGSKILSFFLIPLYTNILSTAEYGIYDIYSTTISLLIPILTLNIYEAVLRFALEQNNDKNNILNVGIKYTLISSLIVFVALIFNKIFNIISIFSDYWIYFLLIFIGESIYTFLIKFCRGIELIKESAFAGVINSISIILLNILYLCVLKRGLSGYFAAMTFSYFITNIYLIIFTKSWKYIKLNLHTKGDEEKMIKYSFPLIFDTISWWIINVSDRYIVTFLSGTSANGIYSMAYKIPSVLNIFQSIFNQAWTISAVKEYNEGEKFYNTIYKIYNLAMILTCSILIIFDKLIAKILFAKDFYIAWKYAPFLMVSVVFGALSGLLGGIFNAAKESKILSKTTVIGCIINILFNVILVYKIGIVGAAISTLIAYIIVWLLRVIQINKIKNININLRKDIFSYLIIISQASIMYFSDMLKYQFMIQIILFVALIILNMGDLKLLLNNVVKMINKNKKVRN